MSYSLDQLANELLFKVFVNLERPAAFSQSCRKFHCITKDSRARAAHFLTKYGPRLAIFYAIRNHAKIVTKETAEAMISEGAIVSRNLAQCLMKDYSKSQSGDYFRCCWASKLPLGSYLVFMQKAYQLYGDNLWSKDSVDDWEQFRICVSHQLSIDFDVVDQHTYDTNRELVHELLDKYNVVPLPLQYFFSAISDTFVMISRIGDDQLLAVALSDLSYFDRYEFVNIIPTIAEKLIFNQPTSTHLKKALDNLFSYQSPVLEDLALELIRKCGLYKVPNVILETLIERKAILPFDLDKIVLKSINDKFHSLYSYNGAPDNIESLWHYFPQFRAQIRSNLCMLFTELRNGAVICNRNDASYYGYGIGCVAVDFILSEFGPSDPVTEQCFSVILRDICDKNVKIQKQRNRLLSTRGNNDVEGMLLQGSPQYFTKYVEAGVVIKPEHLKLVCEKGMKRKWFLSGFFDALDKVLIGGENDNEDQTQPSTGPSSVTKTRSSLETQRVIWRKVIEDLLNEEREKHNIIKKLSKEGRLYRFLEDFHQRHFP